MVNGTVENSEDSLWREVGEKAIKKAVSTFVGEGIKAVVELWKERHLKELDMEFKEREKARKEEAGDSDAEQNSESSALEW